MGSDFTNDDLVRESSVVNDYTHELGEDTVINNYQAYKIIMTPKPDAPVVWGKLIVYIEKEELNQLLIYYYDEDEFLEPYVVTGAGTYSFSAFTLCFIHHHQVYS